MIMLVCKCEERKRIFNIDKHNQDNNNHNSCCSSSDNNRWW